MAKQRSMYICSECGYESGKWYGKCPGCGEWNTMNEETPAVKSVGTKRSSGGYASRPLKRLSEITEDVERRISTGIHEFDRVLGGGIVLGGVVLLSGEPGVGKSTMLLQLCGAISNQHSVLYITGEESVRQVKLRAARLKVPQENIYLAAENDVDEICGLIEKEKPDSLLAGLGGQTGLTLAMELAKDGFLDAHGVRLIGTNAEAIDKAEDRKLFKQTMEQIGEPTIPSGIAETVEDALAIAEKIGESEAELYGVATFYENFSMNEKGKYIIKVCNGTACHVRKSDDVQEALYAATGLTPEEHMSKDGLFTIERVSCLGACGLAPVCTVNDVVHASMTPEKVHALVQELKEAENT